MLSGAWQPSAFDVCYICVRKKQYRVHRYNDDMSKFRQTVRCANISPYVKPGGHEMQWNLNIIFHNAVALYAMSVT